MAQLMQFLTTLSFQQRVLLSLFVLLKIVLILMLPLTGDEAYFIVWGQQLALGYYDHPPAVGWVLAVMGSIADDLTWYRSFAFFSAILISYLLYQMVKIHQADNATQTNNNVAMWIALAFFVSPISLMFVVTANDTVLALFSVLGVYFFIKNVHSQRWIDALLAGLFLGLAFLSKYFAAFMLIGLLAYSLWFWKKLNLKQLLVMVFIVLLAVAENLYFNVTHCWNNILFNFFSRTEQSTFEIGNVISYLLMIALLISPLGLWFLFKNRQHAINESTTAFNATTIIWFASLPLLGILLMVSFTNAVGLHWPLIAVTLLYVIYHALSEQQLAKLFTFNAYFSVIVALLLIVALFNVEQLISPSQKQRVAVYTQPEKVCSYLPKDEMFFTLDYSSQSALSYHCQNDDVHVFASKSKFGREDDKRTDFKQLNNQNLTVFVAKEKELKKVTPYFANAVITELKISDDVTYYLVKGQQFNYALYRESVLVPVNEKFYSAPDWFPKMEPCEFKQKYDLL